MEIEVLEQTEVTVDGVESTSTQAILAAELGMTQGAKFPFRVMKSDELWAYKQVMESQQDYKKFDSEYVPLRILEIIKKYKDSFNEIQIWSVESHEVKDPILVGIKEPAQYSKVYYLLARWGDALVPFEQILAKAVKSRREELKNELQSAKIKIDGMLGRIDGVPDSALQGMSVTVYTNGV
jgi:NADH dehydrogenase/NADH:ubiquinone oxidoreductase subunit G